MGNGAALQGEQARSNFEQIEALCQAGYFREKENFPDYKKACYSAIRHENMDVLEILIPAGNMRKLKPLHVAASMGKLEAVEQLCSAGFDCNTTDKEGRTPLHMCAYHVYKESALCATFLLLQSRKLATVLDHTGQSAAHLAVSHQNTEVIKALINSGVNMKVADKDGRSPLDHARKLGYREMVKLLANNEQLSVAEEQPGAFQHASSVDQERIMKVWEAFFENAFKRFEDPDYMMPSAPPGPGQSAAEKKLEAQRKAYMAQRSSFFGDSDEDQPTNERNSRGSRGPGSSSKELGGVGDAKLSSQAYSSRSAGKSDPLPAAAVSARPPAAPVLSELDCLLSWFAWTVFWDEQELALTLGNSADDDNCYYVRHRDSGETRWLRTHVDAMVQEGVCEGGYAEQEYSPEDIQYLSEKPLPATLYDAMSEYWLTFYDPATNTCSWMNLVTKRWEYYLPLGLGNTKLELSKLWQVLRLAPVESNSEWVAADQYCALAWIVVLIDPTLDDTGDDTHIEGKCADSAPTTTYSHQTEAGEWSISADRSSRTICDDNMDELCQDMYDDYKWPRAANMELDSAVPTAQAGPTPELTFYYLNTVTNKTTWSPPDNWADVTAEWSGWTLCCNEGFPEQTFWYDFASGQYQWPEYT